MHIERNKKINEESLNVPTIRPTTKSKNFEDSSVLSNRRFQTFSLQSIHTMYSLGARGQFLILYVHAKFLMESKGSFP